MKKFLQKRLNEELNKTLIETVIDEEYPTSWDVEKFKTLHSFADRKKYCTENLIRISSGSGRIVYKIDDEKVLKLAWNEKGVQQNANEAAWKDDGYYQPILARIFNYHQKDYWLEMELARRVKPSDFKKLLNFSVDELGMFLRNRVEQNNGRKNIFRIDDSVLEILNESQFAEHLLSYSLDADCGVGDFGHISSYGLVNRDGEDVIVVVDYGLTQSTWKDYYS
jgi:hypothetical protein